VIETFEMTDKPRRLKPINIYYHLYSGSRVASLNALDEVYSWAIKQKTSKLYASQYIKKARGFYATSIAKIDGGYEIRNSGYLRTVRFDKRVDVDIKSSKGVAGFVYENGRTYITLDRSIEHKIKFSQNSTTSPYLIDSNGWVERVSHRDKSYSFELKSNISIDANFYMPSSCKVNTNGDTKIKRVKPRLSISSNQLGVTVAFECK
jgi:hypothetical protein